MKEVVLVVEHNDDGGGGDDDEDVRIDSSDPFRPNPFYFDIILIKISRDKFVTKVYKCLLCDECSKMKRKRRKRLKINPSSSSSPALLPAILFPAVLIQDILKTKDNRLLKCFLKNPAVKTKTIFGCNMYFTCILLTHLFFSLIFSKSIPPIGLIQYTLNQVAFFIFKKK